MKCKCCGGDRFYARQMIRMDVICNENQGYERPLNRAEPMSDIYDASECYGPFQCLGCGAEYEELRDGAEPDEGPDKNWKPDKPFVKVRDYIREDKTRFQRWEGERYLVTINFFGTLPYVQVKIKEGAPKYTPHIFVREEDDMPANVEIQTTSYGVLDTTEYEKMLQVLKLAHVDAQDIYSFFVLPLKEKSFDMGETI